MMSLTNPNRIQLRVDKILFWYAYFMAFPAILFVQNVSVFLFPFLLFSLRTLTGNFFVVRYFVQVVAIGFGIGAIVSVVNIPNSMPAKSLAHALEVLPNYLYWVLLILAFTTHKNWIKLEVVYEAFFWGVLSSVVYYFVIQQTGLVSLPIFKNLSQNTFAFLLISFTPMVVWYSLYRYGFWVAIVIWGGLVICGFLSGSRSGSLLTLSGGVITMLLNRKNSLGTYAFAVVGYFVMIFLIDNPTLKKAVFSLNERTYDLIYNREKTLEEDRSYLVRLAQIEKALLIYEKYPWSGIGLNNFGKYRVKLPGNFEGAKYVVHKKSIDAKSAHNSYIGFLAEGGLLLLIPFVLLLLYCILWFFRNLSKLSPEYKPIFIGIFHMSIHLYFIYAIVNVFAWFLIALGCWVIVKHKS